MKKQVKQTLDIRHWTLDLCAGVLVLFLTVALVLCCSGSLVYAGGKGTTEAFLKLGLGARPSAMGYAYGAVADDANTVCWNPAGMSLIEKKEIVAMYSLWLVETNYQYLAYAMPIPKIGTIGVGFNYFSAGTMEGRIFDTDVPDASFSANFLAFTVAYSRGLLDDKLLVGAGAKIINGTIEKEAAKAPGFALDLGGLYKVNDKMRVALALQNLGTGLKYIEVTNPLPMNVKVAAAYQILKPLIADVDVNMASDSGVNVAIGAEYKLGFGDISLPLRIGYNTGKDLGGMAGLGTGFGVSWKNLVGFDFAWLPSAIGDTLQMSLNLKF